MNEISSVAKKRSFLGKLWALSFPYFRSSEWKLAGTLLISVIAMVLAMVYFNVLLNGWYRAFQNMLQARDLAVVPVTLFGVQLFTLNKFFYLIGEFSLIVLPLIVLSVYSTYLQQMLEIRWRRWLTERFLALWLNDQSYYRLQIRGDGGDNPEQRIEDDITAFTGTTLSIFIGLINKAVTLVTFSTLLWVLSGPISFGLFGTTVTVPGYMVWVALLYALVGSAITYRIGRRLVQINFLQQRFRASFRFRMSRLKENAESVAMYRGEAEENRGLMQSFTSIWINWWELMRLQKRLNWFQSFYGQAGAVFPILVIAPRYFAKAIDFGTIFQIAQAFGQVQDALTWFMDNFTALAEWKAVVNRLIGFVDSLDGISAVQPSEISFTAGADAIKLQDVDINLPSGRALIENFSGGVRPGDRILVSGPSGSGKTTLFRALAGLWPFGSGRISTPDHAGVLFLPQRPYLPIGSLRQALAYPAPPEEFDERAMRAVLMDVNLEGLCDRLEDDENWSMALSIGEQQRLAIARALLLQPDWLYLDEATSALDSANERRMYHLLVTRLPKAAILSIAHREELALHHEWRLEIDPEAHSATLGPISGSQAA